MTYNVSGSGGSWAGGSVLIPIGLQDGDANDLGIYFLNDPGKGLAADSTGFGFYTAHTRRLYIDNDGHVAVSGTLAVTGTTALSGPVTLALGASITNGSAADPNGQVQGLPGSLYLTPAGGYGATLWVKEHGTDTNGWVSPNFGNSIAAACDAAVEVGTCVRLSMSNGAYTATAADITGSSRAPATGIVVSKASSTQCVVACSGMVMVGSGLVAGEVYHVGSDAKLALLPLPSPPNTLYFEQPMGIAVSDTAIVINPIPATNRRQPGEL